MDLVQIPAAPLAIDREGLRRALAAEIDGEVRFDALSRALYATDASVYQILPAGVVIPKSREDILRALAICRRFHCPITMRGGGTSQAGQAIGAGLQIDASKYYNRLLEVNAEERWVRVEPGIVLDELNAQLQPVGLRFAPDISTASRATIGGMVANNSSGARSVIYGKTLDHILELTVALADGSVAEFREVPRNEIPRNGTLEASCYHTVLELARTHASEIERRYPKIMRRVGGYNLDEFTDSKPVNLARIMVGSEGTLGIVLEAKLRLVPLPKAKALLVILFADLLEALEATPAVLAHKPSAVEIMDRSILDHARENVDLEKTRNQFMPGDPAATLCVEFYADEKEELPPRLARLEQDLRARRLGYAYRPETGLKEQARVWALREASLGLSMAIKDDAKSISFVEDTAVAPEKLRDYIDRFLQILRRHETTAGIYAHASVGCLHVRPVINLKTEEGVRKFESIARDVARLVLEFGGSLSAEHGDGYVRSPFLRQMFGPVLYEAFRQVKQTFDPEGLFNPGKIVDSPPLTANLRFGAGYVTPKPQTWFDYSEYGGMGGAVEMCSGVGACRKRLSGTMCPSFMATQDEVHTTRGRANALRLAMNGSLGATGLSDDDVLRVLDLCLECRACKTECPVGVDVARLKSEFLSQYWSRHGTPLKVRALGHVDRWARWGSRFAALANLLQETALVKRLNQSVLGIDCQRSLPRWRHDTLERKLGARGSRKPVNGLAVALFNDTFTNHCDPEIGQAAMEILERGGYAVNVVRPGCCGRPMISQGLLAEAKAYSSRVVAGLFPIAERGEKILFCEPSCLSAVKEDAPGLLRGEEQRKAQIVADACQLFDEFASGLELPLKTAPGSILVHGHCHQKSMGMLPATIRLLSQIPAARLIDLDAGCCGMAGSFGYDREHFEVSRAIAGRRLLPAIAKMGPDDVVVAPGTSCRHQIHDFANKQAVHPAVLIQRLLV